MRVSSERAPDNRTLAPGRNEFEQARRLGTDLKAIRNAIRECWEQSDSGKSFAAALDARGLILARGDKRDFVVIDHAGGDHALSKRITGAPAAEIRARLADIDRRQLPSVAMAKTMQQRARPASEPEIMPTAKRGIGEYQASRNNASATIRTRPIVAPGPETAVATENDTSPPAAEFFSEARAAQPAAVEMQEPAAASIDPGQETPASTGRARSGAEAPDSDHGRERGRERCNPRHRRNGAGDRDTQNSRKVVRSVESGRGGGDSTRA